MAFQLTSSAANLWTPYSLANSVASSRGSLQTSSADCSTEVGYLASLTRFRSASPPRSHPRRRPALYCIAW